ncbi:hypothetical protein PILCRDRAFT_69997 [Piloderma croceum F 1598]|uniref:Ataxin-10 homolog n=1 Tax=Piloderma croceum (strain F 1598) TaxID=765440 RepID=A0A0C3B9I2_PILCF|nr:hypothetical protein PILCRDRAFT_69997 [Piloderma croceum F 1598]
MGKVEPPIWPELQKLWHTIAETQISSRPSWDGNEESLRQFTVNLATFTRNVVAGVPHSQKQVYEIEPEIRRLLHFHTSWSSTQDNQSFKVTRALVQALSNIVTANDALISKLWELYINLPEEQVILIRLLASPDASTVLSVLVFMVNCLNENEQRSRMLCTTPVGARVCITLLDRMVTLFDAVEPSDGAKAFDIGYNLFTRLFDRRLAPELYSNLSIADEIIAPHQTTLLKLLDSYLQLSKESNIHRQLCPMLSETFFRMMEYAQHAIRRALGPNASDGPSSGSSGIVNIEVTSEGIAPPQDLDLFLPKVCEALVLTTQCIATITLEEEQNHQGASRRVDNNVYELRTAFNEARSGGGYGLIESLLELLRLLDLFLPRINFGKPLAQIPRGAITDPTGFSYLKRDLVRLLGILCQGTREVQDRVRLCGGIPVVMNLCVVDERNPYLREHAVFTLHNLLEDNVENQAIVESIKPTSAWDENGVLQNSPTNTQ